MTAAWLALAAAAVQGPPAAEAAARPALRVTLEAPRWVMEGDPSQPLRLRLTVENAGDADARIPARWALGDGVRIRAVAPPLAARSKVVVDPAAKPVRTSVGTVDADPDLRLPPGARLTLAIALPGAELPPTDAFECLFVSESPPAAADAVRVERVEDLRGARAVVETDLGRFTLALAPEAAPLSCRNFVRLAEAGFYDGIAFHRVAKGTCVQAGDPTTRANEAASLGNGGSTYDGRPLPLERSPAAFREGTVGIPRAVDEIYHRVRLTLAEAFGAKDELELDAKLLATGWTSAASLLERRETLESGTSQFFVCTTDLPTYAGRYSAFARVVEGMETVRAIESVEVQGAAAAAPHLAERPKSPVRIRRVTIQRAAPAAAGPAPRK